jgi:hypothetical protein
MFFVTRSMFLKIFEEMLIIQSEISLYERQRLQNISESEFESIEFNFKWNSQKDPI